MKHLALTFVILFAFTMPGSADDRSDALAAKERGDYHKALELFHPFAEQGDVEAQINLCNIYYIIAQGVPRNYAEAVKWCRLAAEQGSADAQFRLGYFYSEGFGVPQSYAEAIVWYRRAAEQGNAEAQGSLGALYASEHGVETNLVEAHMWLNLAAAAGGASATRARDARAEVESRMAPAQIAEAQKLATEWKPQPVETRK